MPLRPGASPDLIPGLVPHTPLSLSSAPVESP